MEPQRVTIDVTVLEKHHLTPAEFIIILASLWRADIDDAAHNMVRMGTARVELGLVMPNQIALDRFYAALSDSVETKITDNELKELAEKLKLVYPKGKQPGTDVYWTDGIQLIIARLRTFFRKYGEYDAEEILIATQKYVNDMKNKPYMKTLKYFIYKDTMTSTGQMEYSSDLYNYLEHKDEVSDMLDPEWTGNLK